MENQSAERVDVESRLLAKAQEVRNSGVLGKSFQLNRLFDHLVEKSAKGECPKEIELAQDVFGIDPMSSNAADATVRATVHRLRKKLLDFGSGDKGERLLLKKGEYRLVLESAADACSPPEDDVRSSARAPVKFIVFCLLAISIAAFAVWIGKTQRQPLAEDQAFWKAIGDTRFPFLLVTGESYAFGQLNDRGGIDRLVVDPDVGSAANLHSSNDDGKAVNGNLVDLNYYMMPEAMGPALTQITPIVHSLDKSGAALQTIGAARFNNDMLNKYNVVFVGLIDGIGELKAPFFDGSRFAVSSKGDEIADLKSGRVFRSDWSDPSQDRLIRRDYAYLSERRGPNGNRLLIVAGLRDPGLVEAAQIMSSRKRLDELSRRVGSESFEALYEVQTIGPANYKSRLLIARALEASDKSGNRVN